MNTNKFTITVFADRIFKVSIEKRQGKLFFTVIDDQLDAIFYDLEKQEAIKELRNIARSFENLARLLEMIVPSGDEE